MSKYAPRLDDRFVAQARAFSHVASLLAMAIGALALVGWLMDVAALQGFGGGITMKANAAIALFLAGTSVYLLGDSATRVWAKRAGILCAAAAGVIGGATLTQHLFGWNLGIDQLLFIEEPGALATASPGRMGPPASTAFALAGVALLLLHRGRAVVVAQSATLVIGLMALLAITGYAYGVETLYGVARYTGIAAHTSVALLLLSAAILAATVDRGIASVVAGDGAGSTMARRLLPVATLGPLLLGWIRLQLQSRGYFDTTFGVAALILAIVVILATLIVRTAIRLNRAEQRQIGAEAGLKDRLHEIETMMDVLPVGLFIAADRDAARITGNRAAREFLRIDDGNLSLSASSGTAPTHFRVLIGGIEVPPTELPVQRAAREGVAVQDLEVEVAFEDGVVRHGLLTALPLFDDRGTPRGAVASVMDVTARKAAEREREELLARERDARSDAEAANRAKDEFLATVSHELRTPLNAILGWASMLRDHTVEDDSAVERALATIERNCRTQAQLIEDLLDVSRIVAGKLLLDVKPVDLVGVIKAAADAVRPAADARDIHLRMTVDPTASAVRGDQTRLQQVVWNLLSNAVKFSPRGARVEVSLAADDSNAVITVTDAGAGIDPEFLPFVFERFRQADGSHTRRFTGLGLGLSIVRNLVELHGGSIEAASTGRDRGATFTVRLPRDLRIVEPAVAVVTSQAAETATTTSATLRGLRILAVDDESDVRNMMRTLLEEHGADVVTAASSQEALDTFHGWKPHLLVSDIGMPGQDGYELIRRLRELERGQSTRTPAIALTGYATVDERLRALTAGYQMFVPKPVQPEELVSIIENLTGRTTAEIVSS